MSDIQNYDRFFGGGLFNGGLFGGGFILIILFFLFILGGDFLEDLFCNEELLIWMVLLFVLFLGFDFGGCC